MSPNGPQRHFRATPDVGRFRTEADINRQARTAASVADDPGCVKTLRGITAPGILGSTVTRRVKKRKNLSSARHYDQIRFRFHTAKTHKRRGAVALSSRLSTRFIGSFADKPTESGNSTIVWVHSSASPKRPPCKRRGHYG